MEIFIANDTIAILIASPNTSDAMLNGGKRGAGIPLGRSPTIFILKFSLNLNKYANSVPKTTLSK
jgi:hypothetical protein